MKILLVYDKVVEFKSLEEGVYCFIIEKEGEIKVVEFEVFNSMIMLLRFDRNDFDYEDNFDIDEDGVRLSDNEILENVMKYFIRTCCGIMLISV